MVTRTDERIERFRTEFLPKLTAVFHPTLVLAFGSRARGESLSHSDLDLLIVSDAFEGVRWLDRPVKVIELIGISFGVDVLCYTPQEYARKREEFGVVRTATEEGVALLDAQQDGGKGSGVAL